VPLKKELSMITMKQGFASAFALVLAAVAGAAGCGNSTSTTTGGGGSTGTTGSGGGTGGTVTQADTCDYYCTAIQAHCVNANEQFTSTPMCQAVCKTYAAGPIMDSSDDPEDNLGCRIYHADVPASMDPATHCFHAGPAGGEPDECSKDFCGTFCGLAAALCTGTHQQYADTATCMTDCAKFPVSAGNYSTADTAKNDQFCRLYHLTAASLDPTTHCEHIVSMSAVCTM
jgi:hypothetical protein